MRFLFIGAHYPALRRELRKLGHECKDVDHWALFCRRGALAAAESCHPEGTEGGTQSAVNDHVRRVALEYKPDVIVQWKGWIDGARFILPDTISYLKDELDCLTVYWSVDDPDFVGFWRQHMSGIGVWDVALTCCAASKEIYRKAGVRYPHYFLPAFDTEWPIDTLEGERETADLVVAGHSYAPIHGADMGRAAFALAVKRAGYKVEIYGPNPEMWTTPGGILVTGHPELRECYRGWLQHDDVWKAYIRGKVVLNNHLRKGGGYDKRYTGYCNDKIFQIAGANGATQLMDYQPGISPDVYTAGLEFVQYRKSLEPQECLDSAFEIFEDLIANDDVRYGMRDAARKRTLAEHTWRHRAEQLMQICKTGGKG